MSLKDHALEYHRRGRPGKIEVTSTKPLATQRDLSLAYSPGVAEPCLEIAADANKGWEYTTRGNLVAVVTNGTAVLGLGDIGPLASKPVMEGKAGLFKKFADIDVFDIEIAEKDVDKFVDVVAALEPTFGGVNLEDISAPACFEIEDKLRKRMRIPVFHDDQHGTAIIAGAGILNACEIAGKRLEEVNLVVSGAGASAIACTDFFVLLGGRKENVTLVDSKGVIHEGRGNLTKHKLRYARPDAGPRTLADALVGADLFLGLSVGGLVTKQMVQTMAERPIVFALANPDPEIAYADALQARPDALVATGRSDFPNQVNNVLGFPYIFRGALDVRATTISEDMKVAAARALAALAHEPVPDSVIRAYGNAVLRFGPEYLIPKPFDSRVLWWVAPAVAKAAIDSGVARDNIDIAAYRDRLESRSNNAAFPITRGITRAARRDPKRIVFPEGENMKLLRAVHAIAEEGIAHPVVLGRPSAIGALCEKAELSFRTPLEILDPRTADDKRGAFATRLFEMRQRKGMTRGLAHSLVGKSNYFGFMMLDTGEVDGLVSGLKLTYPETLRPALQLLGLRPGVKVATSMYMMVLKNSVKFFADATINVDPDADTLADIAIQVSDAVAALGVTPRVAMVSFSNFGSVQHVAADKVRAALELVRAARPQLEIDGEMQADLALDKTRRDESHSFSTLSGDANVLIFSCLDAANAAYKVLQSLSKAEAVGPMLLGVGKPVSLLQAEASVDDIIRMTAYTVVAAQSRAKEMLATASD